MFNLQGSEIIFILLIALVVLGPEKLPGAIRRAMRTYQELRKMGDGFQSEFRSAIDEPLREMKETASLIRDQADPQKVAEEAEKAAHAAARKESTRKATVDQMHADGERVLAEADVESNAGSKPDDGVDEWADPVDESPTATADWSSPVGAPAEALAPPAPSAPAADAPDLPADPTAVASDDDENAA